jgi:uncharacterized protein YdcH (DUF465 family)
MMAKPAILDGNSNEAERLQQTHAELDKRVRELSRRAFLTPAEQAEAADLKKRKLAVKDQIRASQPPPEPSTSN